MKKKVLITWLLLAVTGVLHAQELADTLDASRISALREKTRNTTQTGLMHIESKQLTSGIAVFGTPDVIKKLQLLPGVAAGNELMSGLYVHGGDGNDNLFLLDGVPLYNISHFGGLFSSFNTDIIDNLDFYKSGFPARYGGRMSSVVDVETREGNMKEYHGSASLGLIDGRVQVEGPIVKEKTSFNVGLRRTWMDVVTIPAIWYANRRNGPDQTVGGGYAMWDINARVTHRFAPGNVLNACFYTGADDLRASLETKDASNMKLGVKWGSLTGSVSHFYEFSKKLKVKTALYYTQSTSDTGYNFGFRSEKEGVVTRNTMDDKDIASVREVGLTSNWDWYPNQYNHVRYGLSAQYHWYHSGRTYASSAEEDGVPTSKNGDDVSQGYRAFEPAVYAEDEIFLRYNLTLNAGLRFALFATPGKTYPSLEPRVAFKWLINNSISAKLSYTRMSQFAHLVSAVYMDLPSNSWMPSTAHAKPMVSDQVAGGIYTSFGPFTFNLEGWYKTMENVLVYNGSNTFVPPITEWEKSFTEGRGRSWGMELEATYSKGPLTLTAYYTLSWSRRYFEAIFPGWYPDRNDNRHKINLIASWHFAKHWEAFANWNYQDFTTTFRNGHGLKVNLSIYNTYNHLNASLAFLRTDKDGNFSGMAYGLIPIIPTFTVTYKF